MPVSFDIQNNTPCVATLPECPPCPECPECESTTPPLMNAVYDSGNDFIFGVAGGRVYKLDPDTGEVLGSVRFNLGPGLSDSQIAYDVGRGRVWTTYSPSFGEPAANTSQFVPSGRQDKYIYKINPTTLAVEQSIPVEFPNNLLSSAFEGYDPVKVIRALTVAGSLLSFTLSRLNTDISGMEWIVFNPDSLPFSIWSRTVNARWTHIEYVAPDVWISADGEFNNSVLARTVGGGGVFVENSGGYPACCVQATTKATYGFTYVSSVNKVYAANRSNLILRLDWGAPYGGTAIDVGATDIWHVRKHPTSGLLYCPDFGGNQIIVLNPSNDSFVVKSGFDMPWDVIFTADKAWAVQHSVPGLKEIV